MHIRETHTSFKITALLYIVVVLLGMGFYYIYTSFENMQQDTHTMHQSGWLRGISEHHAKTPSPEVLSQIRQTLETLSPWVDNHSHSDFYAGHTTLTQEYHQVKKCWETYPASTPKVQQQCRMATVALDSSISRIVYPEQQQLDNMLYIILVITLFTVLYLIYFVRLYIALQMKKHAIHDHETKLYNRKYLMEELKSTCARASRYDYPLSLLSVTITNFDNEGYDEKIQARIMEILGGLITAMIRTSDVACRYDENHIVVLLPFTELSNAGILEARMKETFASHDFMVETAPAFKFSTIQYNHDESPDSCMKRAEAFITS
jgi:diguanylate cyclase (GGDEF)-like protein